MNFAEVCRSRGLELPNVEHTVSQLANLALENEPYAVAVFASFSAWTLPMVNHWIEERMDLKSKVLDRLSVMTPLLPCLKTLTEYFVAMNAPELFKLAESVPAIIRLLIHDYRRYATYVSSEMLRNLAGEAKTARERAFALVALGLLMERSEKQIGEWLKEYLNDSALTDFEFNDIFAQSIANSKDRDLLERSWTIEAGTDNTLRGVKNSSHLFTQIGDVFVPRLGGSDEKVPEYVETTTFRSNVRGFAHKLLTDQPLLLMGERGSGKTSIVEYIHHRVRTTELVRIHLGDQTDAKALVGNYTTGALPGTFEWTPGALTSAVQRGQWVLIEDIDRAPNEIVAVLLSLLTRRELVIPSRNQLVKAAPGFQIVATTAASSSVEIIGLRNFALVNVFPPTNEDLASLIMTKRPFLTQLVADMFVTVFRRVEEWQDQSSHISGNRTVTTRDLVKLANRVGPRYSAEDMFREAVTCFTSFLPNPLPLARVIGDAMSIAESQVVPLLTRYSPQVSTTDTKLIIGRAQLERRHVTSSAARNIDLELNNTNFALTQPTLKLMEEIAVGIQHSEPVLLVGETGTGKTTVVQHIAKAARRKLVVINVSQQVETGDLVGGFKPVDARQLAGPLLDEFYELFDATFSRAKNHQFLTVLDKTVSRQQWKNVVKLMREAVKMATKSGFKDNTSNHTETKRARIEEGADWSQFPAQIDAFSAKLDTVQQAAHFQFIEGLLVRALRQGHWVLLDELNLAPADTVEGISELLSSRSLTILENSGQVVHAHPQFRLFANMNPATDVGKRDLPMSVRTQFTEVWSPSPDSDIEALRSIISRYLPAGTDGMLVNDVAQLYTTARDLAAAHQLVDGAGQRPHFSIRTLARMLNSATKISSIYGLRRALFETFIMSFLTLLDDDSSRVLMEQGEKWLLERLPNRKSAMSVVPQEPRTGARYVQFQHWWMPVSSRLTSGNQESLDDTEYILTPSVERNLLNLVRATALKSYPVLIQGPTSSGKTSMISYLARRTGHTVVRINNHEHTDLAEYMGGYESDADGRLVFKEGALVTALRMGHWLVLDELNLAPTDVLEALNRLLDDNRELLVPETQEVIKPHPDFVLFATQNPPGIYAGRKVLSRAFRNRFLELHFGEIPEQELEQIVRDRTGIAPSYAAKIVEVYRELSRQRIQRVFEQAATLRDLFRWAKRPAIGYEQLGFNGYCLLAERSRTAHDREAIRGVIEKVMRVKIDTDIAALANPDVMHSAPPHIVWTGAMRRVLALVQMAISQNEPVLLVGETGCGKTTIIQALAAAQNQKLLILNAHQNTETSDLVGSQRPVRSQDSNKLFEWVDGPLVVASKTGCFFLLDEISLADDSVLERLNSVLEPERTLFVPEIGSIKASPAFQFFSTMNPGGDYGKKELSPALRNRFTEIWVPTVDDESDLKMIVSQRLVGVFNSEGTKIIVEFSQWFSKHFYMVSLRDILSWVEFVNVMVANNTASMDKYHQIVVHGALLTFIDGLGVHANFAVGPDAVSRLREKCVNKLEELAGTGAVVGIDDNDLNYSDRELTIGGFELPLRAPMKSFNERQDTSAFSLTAPTSALNAKRVVRAMQVRKPVLLEGSPGAGKTSLIAALARLCGARLTRINLSDQTDLSDLFGQDVPLEEPGKFGWRTAPFLRAMQKGEWVLLDEMNLAPQPVLEGLNACLDHRGEAYIPELDRTFSKNPNFTVFAAQNPQGQGGGRKGLPKSYVNRFSVVYVDQLGLKDLHTIAATTHPSIEVSVREKLAEFVEELAFWSSRQHLSGGPFEFNLRDTLRWLDLIHKTGSLPQVFLPMIVTQRLRSPEVKLTVEKMFYKYFDVLETHVINPVNISDVELQIGNVRYERNGSWLVHSNLVLLSSQIPVLETALQCVSQAWPIILVGESGTGKTSIINLLAQLCGATLREFAMTPDIDSTDLLGEFDQLEVESELQQVWSVIEDEVSKSLNHVEDSRLADAVKMRDLNSVRKMIDSEQYPRSGTALAKFTRTDFSKPLFKWVDGMLVRAVEQGDWLVLDNANLCSAAVLDRLNSLLERDGSLSINECSNEDGSPREVKPHPDFRLFLTVNPKYGELSRAMRNRGVEVFLDQQTKCDPKSSGETTRELPLQFSQPLTISRLADLKTRRWLRSLVVDQHTPVAYIAMVDEELAAFSQSHYFTSKSFDALQESWFKFLLAGLVKNSLIEARKANNHAYTVSSRDSLLFVSALRRIRDSVECEFDVYGLLEYADKVDVDGQELFSILLDIAKVTDPSRVPVYRDWLINYCERHQLLEFNQMVRTSLGRQYDFSEGGEGMIRIWQYAGRPQGFATESDHDGLVKLIRISNEFDALVSNLGIQHASTIAQIRLVLSKASSVDELMLDAIENFRQSLTNMSFSKPFVLTEIFGSLWKSLALVYCAKPDPSLLDGIAKLTHLAKLTTQDLRSLAYKDQVSIYVPYVAVPASLESILVEVLQCTQQGQANKEVVIIIDMIVEFGRALTNSIDASSIVDTIGIDIKNELAQIVPEWNSKAANSPLELAKELLHLYVCPLPLDPAIAQHVWYERYIQLQKDFSDDRECWNQMQRLLGSDSSILSEWLRSRTANEQPVPSIWRPKQSSISLVHRDMVAVAQLVVNTCDKKLSEEELDLVQRNADHLYGRLTRASVYRDLVAPVLIALGLLNLYLSRLQRYKPRESPNLWLLDAVTAASGDVDPSVAATTISDLPLLVMRNLQCHPSVSAKTLDAIISNVHRTWTMDRLRLEEQQREQAAGVRYIDGEDDDEAQAEREFKQMFPDYDEVSDIPKQQDSFVPEFVDTYCSLLSNSKTPVSLVDTLTSAAVHLKSVKGESSSLHLPTLLLALNRRSQEPTNAKSSSDINFYTDSSSADADLSVHFADDVAGQIQRLLEMWPEHDTLQTISRVANEIIELPPGAPVAMHLSKVEQLHHNLYEWDRFASKEFKVGDLMAKASSLIVRWRQLELATWPALFMVEKRKAAMAAAPFWFHLYETLVFAPVEDLGNTAKVLVLFMSDSSIGQYHRRLELLLAFENHLKLYGNQPDRVAVRRCLQNIRQYFEQFAGLVQNRLDDLEKLLRKKVDEVVKLASWRDVNIHALKQSAQRSHRQLFKSVRKFRDLLQKPAVTEDLASAVETCSDFSPAKSGTGIASSLEKDVDWIALTKSVSALPEWQTRPLRLQDLSSISNTLDRYITEIRFTDSTALYTLACDIEKRAASLKHDTPNKWTKESKKDIAALKVEKQQLLTSTLRELKRSGLKQTVSKKTMADQMELTRVLATAPNLQGSLFEAGDPQFYAIVELLPRLRAAVSDAASTESNDVPYQDLQRGLALTEDCFAYILRLRRSAADHVAVADASTKSLRSLAELARNPTDASRRPNDQVLHDAAHLINHLSNFIEETIVVGKSSPGYTVGLRKQAAAASTIQRLMTRTNQVADWFNNTAAAVSSLTSLLSSTKAGPLLEATLHTLRSKIVSMSCEVQPLNSSTTEFKEANEFIISASNSVLVVVQQLVKLGHIAKETSEFQDQMDGSDSEADDSNWLINSLKLHSRALATLRSREIYDRLAKAAELVFNFSKVDADAAAGLAASLMVFVSAYEQLLDIVQYAFQKLLHSTTLAVLKLSKLLFALATAGFCSPQAMEDGEDEDEPAKGDGVGLGDGSGGQSSTKDIDEEDDDVTEAMQTANPDQEEREEDGEEDNAKEMEGDMAGEMEDAPSKEEDDDNDNDNEDEEEMDDEVGDLDDLDPNAVDEKMWDDQKPDSSEKEKQTDQNLEGSTNPDDEAEAGNDQNEKQPEDVGEDDQTEEEMEDKQDDQLGGEKDDDNQVEDGTEQKDALDLPDDMQLDDGKDDDDAENEDDSKNGFSDDEDGLSGTEDEDGLDDSQNPADQMDEPQQCDELELNEGNDELNQDEIDNEDKKDEADQGDESESNRSEDELKEPESKPEDLNIEEATENATEGDGQGADIEGLHGPTDYQDTKMDEDQATSTENRTDTRGEGAAEDASAEQSNLGMGGTSGANQDQPDEEKVEIPDQHDQQSSEQIKDSLKQLGDAMQQFHRRQQAIREHEDRDAELENSTSTDNEKPLEGNEELEHVGAEDAFDTQALGKTDEQTRQNIDQNMAIDDEVDVADQPEEVAGDEETGAEHGGGAGETVGDISEESDTEMPDETPVIAAHQHREDEDIKQQDDLREVVPDEMATGHSDSSSRDDLWQVYEAKTHDLALVLGEQLRLILEPTVASKLRGDYRTGKRLNMKRIIPYIASEFRKDKIWLRRSKPAKREYQILLSLDDSKSMGEPAVVDLAFQAIALVGKALGSIEAGQVGIAKFGSITEIVHPLDRPLTTQYGNAVLSQFKFNQQRTNVHQLLTKSLEMFAEHSSGNSEQWKLEIIVSDGITDDHQTLRKLVRQAYDERVMVVFVVLDALNKETSVLDMNEVRYTTDDQGNPKLEVVKYFEDFPFDYYVIVRNITDLPMVLANVLRQYFQAQQG